MEKKISYRVPQGFNPFSTADTCRGLTDAVHHFLLEGPGTKARMTRAEKAGLNSLVELLHQHIHALHDYLAEIENSTTLDLPMTDEDFEALHVKHAKKYEVREPELVYLVR